MRLFIAINFNDETKELVYQEACKLEEKMTQGHITDKNNIHLTLLFIGEVIKVKEISDILSKIDMKEFDLLIKGISYFTSRGKKLYYLAIDNNNQLTYLYETLYEKVTKLGYMLSYQPYTPHVTLAREVELSENVRMEPLNKTYHVTKISLMESRRINGELKYIELYYKELK